MRMQNWIALDHLDRLTDSTGLIQHAIYGIPRRESGYTTDDNARALRLCTRLWQQQPDERQLARVTTYLSFLEYARCPGRGFHNFLSYPRQWLDAEGSGDCQGQAVRALAEVLASSLPDDHRVLAGELIEQVLPALADLRSLRAQAYIVLAWGHLWASGVKDVKPLENIAWSAARRLMECYERAMRPDWRWFESRMTYANAVLPQALFVAARRWPQAGFLEAAQSTFEFLDRATTALGAMPFGPNAEASEPRLEKVFWPVGNDGWHSHGEAKALYDQQPVEAATMAEAALSARGLLGDPNCLAIFRRACDWFYGRNSLGEQLVDAERGGCCDGLQPRGLNRNQGAESTLAYLWTTVLEAEINQALA